MSISMDDYLKVVTPYLGSELVSPVALCKLRAIAQALPPFWLGMLECRLHEGGDQVDFLVGTPRLSMRVPDQFLGHPTWQAIQRLCAQWVDPASPLYDSVSYLWLEFDLEDTIPPIPVPSVFFVFDPQVLSANPSLVQPLTANLIALTDRAVDSQIQDAVQHCFDAVPQGAWVADLGVMTSRPTQEMRFVVKNLAPAQLLKYLSTLGWQDSAGRLEELVAAVDQRVDAFTLAFGIRETICPKIGLECYFTQQPPDETRWQAFLDDLIAQERCSLRKQQAILAWPGVSTQSSQTADWPTHLHWLDQFFAPVGVSAFQRTLNHIKLLCTPEGELEAKAYLVFNHDWLEMPQ